MPRTSPRSASSSRGSAPARSSCARRRRSSPQGDLEALVRDLAADLAAEDGAAEPGAPARPLARDLRLPPLGPLRPGAPARGDERAPAPDGGDAGRRPVQPRPPDLRGAEAFRHRAAVRAKVAPFRSGARRGYGPARDGAQARHTGPCAPPLRDSRGSGGGGSRPADPDIWISAGLRGAERRLRKSPAWEIILRRTWISLEFARPKCQHFEGRARTGGVFCSACCPRRLGPRARRDCGAMAIGNSKRLCFGGSHEARVA